MTHKMHAGHVEVAVAKLIGYRTHTIVPNVSWGLGLNHECDMLVLDQQNRFTEIEIKVSASDLKKDFTKWHGHKNKIISRHVYAMPISLCEKYHDLIPKTFGIISVEPKKMGHENDPTWIPMYEASWYRLVKHKVIETPCEKKIRKFMELGCMRIWSLKEVNNRKIYKNTSR